MKAFFHLVLWLLACASISIFLGWFGPWMDELDQKQEAHEKLAKIMVRCGEGAAPVLDKDGNIVDCKPRKGKSS